MADSAKEVNVTEKIPLQEISVIMPWGNIAAKCWGDPCSQPVLVLHGIQDNAGSFDRLLPLLPRCFYYVCMELPGHGRSERIPKGLYLDFMQFITTIYRFVLHFSWSKFYILGHSLGGQLGVYYSAMYPEQVIKLITLDTLPMMSLPLNEFLDFYKRLNGNLIKMEQKLMQSSPPNYTYEEAVERLMTQRPSPINREAAEALVKRILVKGKSGYHFSTDQRLKFGVRHPMPLEQNVINVSKVQCPYLLILTKIHHEAIESQDMTGSGKPILRIFEKMKNVSVVFVEGYHDVHNNEPEIVAPYISEFLVHQKSSL